MSTDQDSDASVSYATDPTLARTVIEERGGFPAHAAGSEGTGDQGALRVGFPDVDDDYKEISWEAFTEEFEEKELAAVYADDEDATVDDAHPVVLRERSNVSDE